MRSNSNARSGIPSQSSSSKRDTLSLVQGEASERLWEALRGFTLRLRALKHRMNQHPIRRGRIGKLGGLGPSQLFLFRSRFPPGNGRSPNVATRDFQPRGSLRPIRELRIWISEALTQADSYSKGVEFLGS